MECRLSNRFLTVICRLPWVRIRVIAMGEILGMVWGLGKGFFPFPRNKVKPQNTFDRNGTHCFTACVFMLENFDQKVVCRYKPLSFVVRNSLYCETKLTVYCIGSVLYRCLSAWTYCYLTQPETDRTRVSLKALGIVVKYNIRVCDCRLTKK